MADRSQDGLAQAERDLAHAEMSRQAGHHEWVCFAAQQAAEKAVNALHQRLGQEAWGHVVRMLLEDLPPEVRASEEILDRARVLDSFYIPTRYASGHPAGAPRDHCGDLQNGEAIEHARAIIEFARLQMA